MPRRTIGTCGLVVPAVGVGCWTIGGPDTNLGLPMGWGAVDDEESTRALRRAYELGARLFDTADVYGHGHSERLLGRLVADRAVSREEVVLSTKVGYFAGTAAHGFDPSHMRRQLEQSLDNLHTDYVDIYFLHHSEFGEDDRWLEGAVAAMHAFRREGLVRAIGMRGPHRYTLDRLARRPRADKVVRFQELFELVRPDVLAVRDNLLTPRARSAGIFEFADRHGCGVLINKPLAQGLLTGAHDPVAPRVFGEGDHRGRKRWFTAPALAVMAEGLVELRELVGDEPSALVRVALWSCLERSAHAAVLAGFRTVEQVTMNLTSLGERPDEAVLARAEHIMGRIQARLDADGEVFLDEPAAVSPGAAP